MTEWVKCSDRLPEKDIGILIFWNGNVRMAELQNTGSHFDFFVSGTFYLDGEDVTHWMPLPEPPND